MLWVVISYTSHGTVTLIIEAEDKETLKQTCEDHAHICPDHAIFRLDNLQRMSNEFFDTEIVFNSAKFD